MTNEEWKDAVIDSLCKYDCESVEEVYQKGRADAIRKIEEIECEGIQRADGKYIKLSSFQKKLEQIKEQDDER